MDYLNNDIQFALNDEGFLVNQVEKRNKNQQITRKPHFRNAIDNTHTYYPK